MKFIADIFKRFDYKPNFMTVALYLCALAMYGFRDYFDPEYFRENKLMENLQLLVLAVAAILAWRSKNGHQLFVFVALIAIFMMIRETNMMRKWTCILLYGPEYSCGWENLGYYGVVLKFLRDVYMVYMVWYFIKNKIWQPIWQYAQKAPIFVWDLLILAASAFVATLAEKECCASTIMEECFELVMYLAFANCIWRYRQVKI